MSPYLDDVNDYAELLIKNMRKQCLVYLERMVEVMSAAIVSALVWSTRNTPFALSMAKPAVSSCIRHEADAADSSATRSPALDELCHVWQNWEVCLGSARPAGKHLE